MNRSREELVQNRDEIIERLQGEWPVDKDIKSVDRKARRVGMVLLSVMTVLWVFGILIVTPFRDTTQHTMSLSEFFMILLIGPAIGLVLGLAIYGYLHAQSAWYRRFGPIVIQDHQLVWNKRPGFVPEKLDLHRLIEVFKPEQESPGAMQWAQSGVWINSIVRRFGINAMDNSTVCMFISPGEHNTPKIRPVLFQDGPKMVSLLEQVAEINKAIKDLGSIQENS